MKPSQISSRLRQISSYLEGGRPNKDKILTELTRIAQELGMGYSVEDATEVLYTYDLDGVNNYIYKTTGIHMDVPDSVKFMKESIENNYSVDKFKGDGAVLVSFGPQASAMLVYESTYDLPIEEDSVVLINGQKSSVEALENPSFRLFKQMGRLVTNEEFNRKLTSFGI